MIEGSSVVPAIEGTNSSYRCEGVGILAILDTLTDVCNTHNITKGSMTICCDNLMVIENMESWSQLRMTPSHKNADLMSACLRLRDSLPININWKHIYGHQDESIPYHMLPRLAQINIDMDHKAKELVTKMIYNKDIRYSRCDHPHSFMLCT